jgi:hypothetical protein
MALQTLTVLPQVLILVLVVALVPVETVSVETAVLVS